MADESSPKPPAPIRARRWSGSAPTPARPRPYRVAVRLVGIPAAAVVGVLIYSGLQDHFVLPQCDSARAKKTLTEVLKQLQLEPLRYTPIKTVSSSKDEVVCNALLPLPDGANVSVDYSFYWEANSAKMKYSVSRKSL